MKKLLFVFGLGFILAGCSDGTDTPLYVSKPVEQSRIQIERIGVFPDDLAYKGKRGIYVITDRVTKKEYIGISGISISEVGTHEHAMEDER